MAQVALNLTVKQARLLKAAVNAEIRKGSSTFLSGRDVVDLCRMLDSLTLQIAQQEATERFKETV